MFWWILLIIFCLFVLYLFLTFPHPTKRMKKALRKAGYSDYYAHRGLHCNEGDAPENSLRAFEYAVNAGYGIELDVQISSDGVAMVFHDDTLMRVCGKKGGVVDYTCAELSAMPLFGKQGTGIPTFEQVLKTVDGKVPLIVEIKAGLPEWRKTIREAVKLLDNYKGFYVVESFNPFALSWLRLRRPKILRGQLCAYYTGEHVSNTMKAAKWFLLNFLSRPDFIAYNYKDSKHLPIRILHGLYHRPTTFAAWTVRSEEEESKCTDYDIIIFENYTPSLDIARVCHANRESDIIK